MREGLDCVLPIVVEVIVAEATNRPNSGMLRRARDAWNTSCDTRAARYNPADLIENLVDGWVVSQKIIGTQEDER